jgi:hypothetical protein
VDICQGLDASLDCAFETLGRVGLSEMYSRLYSCQHVLGPVLGFPSKNSELPLTLLALRDVTGDF